MGVGDVVNDKFTGVRFSTLRSGSLRDSAKAEGQEQAEKALGQSLFAHGGQGEIHHRRSEFEREDSHRPRSDRPLFTPKAQNYSESSVGGMLWRIDSATKTDVKAAYKR